MRDSDFDAVIVGAGAGGAAAAWRLSTQGLRVLVLEAGPAYDPLKDYKLDTEHWESENFPAKPGSAGRYTFAPMQPLQPLQEKYQDLRSWDSVSGRSNPGARRAPSGPGYHHVRGVGGATLHFTGEAHRLHPQALQMRSRFGVGADWPLDYAALEPYYLIAEQLIGVAGPNAAGERWRSAPYPLPAHALNHGSQRLGQAAATLGLSWTANPRAALSQPYDGRPACNYCGNCNRGCPRTDKGSVDVTFLRHALATGRCEVRPDTSVTRILVGSNGTVREIECVDKLRKRSRIPTQRLILACGAIETPRLLLASANPASPRGLANESGQVGKNLMESLGWVSTGLLDESVHSYKGLPADAICWDYNRPDAIPGAIGGCRFSAAVHEAGLVGPINYAMRLVPGWGKAHKAALRKAFGAALSIGAIGEFLPNAGSYVDLDPKARDAHGIPLARIHSQLGQQEILKLQFMAQTCRKILHAAGVQQLAEEYGTYDYFSAAHVFGTCRMGANPNDAVVDARGRSHRWRNLFICDASVFPSSGGGEAPSLTIEALALRSADHILGLAREKTSA
jgi:choline dehydrogenase-like flavoprotein